MQNVVNKPCHLQSQSVCIQSFPRIIYTVIPAFFHDLVSTPGCQIKLPGLQSGWFVSPAWRDPSESGEMHIIATNFLYLIACLSPQPPVLLILRLFSTISEFLSSFLEFLTEEIFCCIWSVLLQRLTPAPASKSKSIGTVRMVPLFIPTPPSGQSFSRRYPPAPSVNAWCSNRLDLSGWCLSQYSWALSEPFTAFLSPPVIFIFLFIISWILKFLCSWCLLCVNHCHNFKDPLSS